MAIMSDSGVGCNNCGRNISSPRYHCLECKSFDLCKNCKSQGIHDQHFMAYLENPNRPTSVWVWPYYMEDGVWKNLIGVHGPVTSDGVCGVCGLNFAEKRRRKYWCRTCPEGWAFCRGCFETKKSEDMHVVPPQKQFNKNSSSGWTTGQGHGFKNRTTRHGNNPDRDLSTRFQKLETGIIQKEGMNDVTAQLGTLIETLMNKTVHDINDLGIGKDADGVKFSRFKVTKVREIFMNEKIYKLYVQQLINIRSDNPPRLDFEIDTSVHWLNKKKKKPGANEVFLFHGTKAESSEVIAKGGFDERVAALKGMYGSGIYFAENADKADHYTKHNGASRQMFLARVILGNPYKTAAPTSGFRRPPAIDEAADSTKRYDSVIAVSKRKGHPSSKLERYQEFIVYDRNQCLPVYLIDYVHE